jgi:purine-binding chemotaxis protein CheW
MRSVYIVKYHQNLHIELEIEWSIKLHFQSVIVNKKNKITTAKQRSIVSVSAPINAWSLMPKAVETKYELHKRAQLLLRRHERQHDERKIPYVRFRLGPTEMYGIPYKNLEEVMSVSDITHVPCTPKIIAGVVNYRGEILSLLDLKQLFHTQQVVSGEDITVIVVKSSGIRVGLVIDEIDSNDEYNPMDLAPAIASVGLSNIEYVQGIDQGKVTILNLDVMLADQALHVEKSIN